MDYSTTWSLLDKNKKVLKEFNKRACFAPISGSWNANDNIPKETHYILYDFSNWNVTEEEARRYFMFVKKIPEFTLMLKGQTAKKMAEERKVLLDTTKFNGVQLFAMLTVIRAVREDPKIVQQVIRFSRTYEYSISKLAILKLCGATNHHNDGHWLTGRISKKNIAKGIISNQYWKEKPNFLNTGLILKLHGTFSNDGWGTNDVLTNKNVETILKEKEVNIKVKNMKQQKAEDDLLVLDF